MCNCFYRFKLVLVNKLKIRAKKIAEKQQIKPFLTFFFGWNYSSFFKNPVNYKKCVGTVELYMVSLFLASLMKYLSLISLKKWPKTVNLGIFF